MNTHRVRVVPREGNREAREFFTYHMKRDGYMYCDERLHQWHLHQPNSGIVAYMVTIIRKENV